MKAGIIGLNVAAVLLLMLLSVQTAYSAGEDEKAVRKAAAEFYEALNSMFSGDVEPMKNVWSHADDVTYMGPEGEYLVGWKAVEKNWEAVAALKLGGEIGTTDMQITVGKEIAFTHNYEKGVNQGPDGDPISVSIRVTNIFRRENGTWKMIGHHTDLLPFLGK